MALDFRKNGNQPNPASAMFRVKRRTSNEVSESWFSCSHSAFAMSRLQSAQKLLQVPLIKLL
jgi:hypothetical protein